MNSSHSSPPHASPLKPIKRKTPPSSPLSIATKTPDTSSTRPRNRRDAVSLIDVREVADQGVVANLGRYEILCEFFDSLDSSIRLLRLKGSMCSFTNICSKIECLTDRRFTYGHLAQLKYVMPEAIEVKRVNVFDKRTCCMKPDLHVSINVDAIERDENSKLESKNMHLRKVFRARLVDFVNSHPECDEVPEELLSEPFNHSKSALRLEFEANDAHVDVVHNCDSSFSEPIAENHQPTLLSHFAPSFRRHFSMKVAINKDVHQSDISPPESCHQEFSFNKSTGDINRTKLSAQLVENEKLSAPFANFSDVPAPCLPGDTIKGLITQTTEDDSAAFQSTPAKFASASLELMSTTPALPPQRRCYMTPDNDSISSKDKLVRRATRPKSLKFEDPVESEVNFVRDASDDDDILNDS